MQYDWGKICQTLRLQVWMGVVIQMAGMKNMLLMLNGHLRSFGPHISSCFFFYQSKYDRHYK